MSETIVPGTNGRPLWTNPPITLYHGTTAPSAQSILTNGVDVLCGRGLVDFGRGFYTTTNERAALDWAYRKSRKVGAEPFVIPMTINRVALGNLESIVFVRSAIDALEYWSFVENGRSGLPHRPLTSDYYDVAYGPIAKVWVGARNVAAWDDFDQISFHTRAAQDMLNNKGMCTLEPMP